MTARLTERAEQIVASVRDDPGCVRVTDLVIAGPDGVVAEHAVAGGAARDLFSVTKSVLALVTGAAIAEEWITLDTPLRATPGLAAFDELDGQTVRHLLTMSRGAESAGEFDLDLVAVRAASWAADFARAPRLHPPGTLFGYDNGASQLLAEVLQRSVPDGLAAFARRVLFAPLGFGAVRWRTDPSGTPVGPGHLWLTARELARIGRLLLDGGRWQGRQLVPAGWVTAMRSPSSAGGGPERRPYGMGLWLEPDGAFFGAGWAGQLLYCRPSDGLVLVSLSDPGFDYGPPATDLMPPHWVAPLTQARRLLLD